MSNPNPYKIKPAERGHRPRISDEPTRVYTLRVPESWIEKLKKLGSLQIREYLKKIIS